MSDPDRGTTLVLLLGDQLDIDIASLRGCDPGEAVVLLVEVAEEAGYVRHHKAKIAFLFSAMRHFADALRERGWTVDYVRLDDPGNAGSFTGEVARAIGRHDPARIRVTEPGEWRVQDMIEAWPTLFGVPVDVLADDRFFVSRRAFSAWAARRERLLMEDFYRALRKRERILMAGGRPRGGRWNFDKENRRPAPAGLRLPRAFSAVPDAVTRDVLELVASEFAGHFGSLDGFDLAVTREDALLALEQFVAVALPDFGTYQDAMIDGEPWIFHSRLSAYINAGLLRPREVAAAAIDALDDGHAPLNTVEGFVRQILGWREYVRGVYWLEGPDYPRRNALDARRDLPAFYWTGETDMRCLADAIAQTRDFAYAHHIQRLMVLGNFAMLAGVDPYQVHQWFLVVYADAYEWVEAPNVIGMSQFADGGLMGSKPYAGGGAYIHRMSDHCERCRYDVSQRVGEDACPFNALYWDFLARNREKLGDNIRLALPYRNWDRMTDEQQQASRRSAADFLTKLPPRAPGWAVAE